MKKLLSAIESIDNVLLLIIKPIVALISLFVAVMLAVGILSRTLFEKPVFGLEELILMAAMWLYMLGAVLASRDRSHLSADFVQVVSSNPGVVRFFHLLATVISLFMAVMFSTWSYDLMMWAVNKGQTTTVFQLPWYISQSSLFFGSILFIFYLIRDFFNDLISFQNRNQINN